MIFFSSSIYFSFCHLLLLWFSQVLSKKTLLLSPIMMKKKWWVQWLKIPKRNFQPKADYFSFKLMLLNLSLQPLAHCQLSREYFRPIKLSKIFFWLWFFFQILLFYFECGTRLFQYYSKWKTKTWSWIFGWNAKIAYG